MHLHITNLGSNITSDSLWATFAAHGTVAATQLLASSHAGEWHRYAHVHMPDAAEATTAVQQLNGSIIDGKKVMVIAYRPR